MSTPLRTRADHAAKYGANLVVPAREIKDLLDELDAAETAREAEAARADDAVAEARALTEELDRARLAHSLHLEATATLDQVRGALASYLAADHDDRCDPDAVDDCNRCAATEIAAALAEGGDDR